MIARSARRTAVVLAIAGFCVATSALADDKVVRIGVLNDMTSLYADIGGPNSVAAIKMAVDDSGLAWISMAADSANDGFR